MTRLPGGGFRAMPRAFPSGVLTDFAPARDYTSDMRIIYADTLMLWNAAVDYLLLLSAGKLCALPLRRVRMALGALWGGAFALLAAVYPGLFGLWTAKLAAGALAVLVAFGVHRRPLRTIAAFYAVAAAFGGTVYAAATLRGEPLEHGLPVSMPVLLLSFALCYGALTLVFRHIGRRTERRLHRAELTLGGRTACFSALDDSGNELIDPVSGCAVLIAAPAALAPLFDRPELLDAPPAEAMVQLCSGADGGRARFRLLPCRCAAQAHGLLLCFRPDKLLVDGEKRDDLLVAVSRGDLAPDGTYEAIL